MNDAMLEKELENFDYSTVHPVKEKILNDLLKMQRETKAEPRIARSMSLKRVDLESLNYVAAAGDASTEGPKVADDSTTFIQRHFK